MTGALELGAMFPFLPEGRELTKKYQILPEDLLANFNFQSARKRGLARVEAALQGQELADFTSSGREADLLEEVLSYLYARILVSAVNDSYLTKKYCLSEAKLLERRLKRLNAQESTGRGQGAYELGPGVRKVLEFLKFSFVEVDDGRIGLHFSDYLKLVSLIGDKNWALTLQDVKGGVVRLERDKAFRVLEEAYRFKLFAELPLSISEMQYPLIQAEAEELALMVKEVRARFEGAGGVLDEESFPPCIKHLMEMTGKGENVPHMGRFTLVAFLHTIGYDKEGMISLFSRWPDFNISKSMYQIQHIIGEISGTEYTPPMCSTMKTYQICFNPDKLCETINHPLNYYRWRLKLSGKLPAPPRPGEEAPKEE
jgi:DNA primase large subunit